jgi:hypothetical protein
VSRRHRRPKRWKLERAGDRELKLPALFDSRRQSFDASRENVGELLKHFLMDHAIAGQGFATFDTERSAVEVAHAASRLFDQQRPGGGVPRIQGELPEAVVAACAAQQRSSAAYSRGP